MYLSYRLVEVAGNFELCDLLSPLKNPEALGAPVAPISPGREDLLLPGIRSSYVCRSLWTSDEDEVQAALKIVGLEGSADRCGDLKGCLAQRDRSEGNTGRGYQSDGL